MKTKSTPKVVRRCTVILVAIGVGLLLYLCAREVFGGAAADYRNLGFKQMNRGFGQIYKPSGLHEIVKLKDVTVHIVGDRELFQWDTASAYGSPVQGCATRKNEIWVFGARVRGWIVLNQGILGHEFNHLLQFNNPLICNPDQLDNIGA